MQKLNGFVEKLMNHIVLIDSFSPDDKADLVEDAQNLADAMKSTAETFLDAAKASKQRMTSFLNSLAK